MPTTHIINWKANAIKQPLVVITDPESITTGDKIKLSLYSANQYNLISPYNGLGSKTIAASLPRQDEIIDLSGSSEISAKYPIKSVFTIVAAIPIVDETSRAIVVEAGMSMLAFISVVNQQLKIADGVKLHGSIRLVYETFNAQVWTHNPFTKKCSAMLFAQNLTTLEYENVPLSIEKTTTARDSIKIEPWTVQPKQSFSPYHAVVIYPSNKSYKIKCDYGSVKFREPVTHTIKAEEVSFSGLEASLSYPASGLVKVTGIFFDAKLNDVNPNFRLSDGVIKSNVECYGFAIVDYTASGLIYDYDADVKIDLVNHLTTITAGYIIVQEVGKTGIGASYKVPLWNSEIKKPIDFYTVQRKVISQDAQTFEFPPNFDSDDNNYPNMPGLAEDLKPEIGRGFVSAVVIEAGTVDSAGSVDYSTHSNIFFDPYHGAPENPDAVYVIETNIPTEIKDTSMISTLEEKIAEAKERWGIA